MGRVIYSCMLEHVQIRECAGSPNRADIGQQTVESILSRRYSTYTTPALNFLTQGVADHPRKFDEALTSLSSALSSCITCTRETPRGRNHWSPHPCLGLSVVTANLYPRAAKEDKRSIYTAKALSGQSPIMPWPRTARIPLLE